jgi:hypothetical protein
MFIPRSLMCPNLICHNFITYSSKVGSTILVKSMTMKPYKKIESSNSLSSHDCKNPFRHMKDFTLNLKLISFILKRFQKKKILCQIGYIPVFYEISILSSLHLKFNKIYHKEIISNKKLLITSIYDHRNEMQNKK